LIGLVRRTKVLSFSWFISYSRELICTIELNLLRGRKGGDEYAKKFPPNFGYIFFLFGHHNRYTL